MFNSSPKYDKKEKIKERIDANDIEISPKQCAILIFSPPVIG
jgi:hypothetical protein